MVQQSPWTIPRPRASAVMPSEALRSEAELRIRDLCCPLQHLGSVSADHSNGTTVMPGEEIRPSWVGMNLQILSPQRIWCYMTGSMAKGFQFEVSSPMA